MDRISECSTPVSSISGYNNKILKIIETNSENDPDDGSDSPAATLLKSYLRDSQRFSSQLSSSSKLGNDNLNDSRNKETENDEISITPKPVQAMRKKRFDVSSPSAILRERNPFPKEVFDDTWGDEPEDVPAIPFNELLKGLHMFAEVRDKEDNRSAGIKVLLRSMGATVHDKLDKEVTHVIFREGQPSTYKKAKKQNCHLLSMLWLHAVRSTGRRVPEQCYPALNLDVYESPVAIKKFRKFKSMQPDYEDVREDYHRKRLKKVFDQKKAALSSNGGSDSDDKISGKSSKRGRKSEILPGKTKVDKGRRKTIMSTVSVVSDMSDDSIPRKSVKRRKTAIFDSLSSSPILNRIAETHTADKTESTNRSSSILENRNVVVNQTLRPSAVFDLVQGSQDILSSNVIRKPKTPKKRVIDDENDLTTCSPNIKNRNVVVNRTLTPPRTEDILEPSQDNLDRRNFPRSPSTSSDATTLDNDHCESPDLKRVLEALDNDSSGSLRKKLLKGLGIKCSSETKTNSKERVELTPEKGKLKDHTKGTNISKEQQNNENVGNSTASTVWGDSPPNVKHQEVKRTPSMRLTRTRNVRTPSRFLDDIENCENNADLLKMDKNTSLNFDTPSKKANVLQENKTKSVRRRANLFHHCNDISMEKTNEEPKIVLNEKSKEQETKPTRRRTMAHKLKENSEEKTEIEIQEKTIPKKIPAKERTKNNRRKTIFLQTNDSPDEISPNKKVPATEGRKSNVKRKSLFKQSDVETSTYDSALNCNNKSPVERAQKCSRIPATEPPKRSKNVSGLNSRMSRKIKLYDPTLDAAESDVSIPENSEPVTNPYLIEDTTPKRRVIDLVDTRNRRSSFWFQTAEERGKATSKKLTQKLKGSQNEKPTIVCTRLHADQIDVFNQIVNKLGGFEIENNVSSRTTHLVAGEANRTLNMLRAIIRGCWIVNYEWLLKSLDADHWLQEELYEVTEFSPAVKKCRIERQTFGEPYAVKLFNECGKIYISSQTSPKSSDLEQLIKLAGGKVVTSPRLARIVVGQRYSHADDDIVCVSEKWILESISHKCVRSFKNFLLPARTDSKS